MQISIKTDPIDSTVKILNDKNPTNYKSVCEKLTSFINQLKADKKISSSLNDILIQKLM